MSPVKARTAVLVAAAWVLIGIVEGAQSAFGASLQGRALTLGAALRASLVQTVPWIPMTLAVIALAVRFPLSRSNWRSRLGIHLTGALVVAFAANLLTVLGFWLIAGRWDGLGTLALQASRWTLMRVHIAVVIYAVIAAVTQAIVAWRAAREHEIRLARVEGQLTRARLQALTAQIRPHFLFNTLHTIGQLWRSGRSDEADAMLDHLGALFHRVQDTTARTEIALAEELQMAREYLAIEEVRFHGRMQVVIEADPAALECAVPPLILQPLVENAVRHGLSAVSSAGRIELHAAVTDGRLRIVIRDDGPGLDAAPTRPGSGMGLSNTRERIAQLYGGLASLTLEPASGGGTAVRIEMPMRREGDVQSGADVLEPVIG